MGKNEKKKKKHCSFSSRLEKYILIVKMSQDDDIENHFIENDSEQNAIFIMANKVWENRKIRFPSFVLN